MTVIESTPTTTWVQANHSYLRGESERLRLLLKRRVLWLRKQWAREVEPDFQGLAISDTQADQLLAGENRHAEALFYQSDTEAQQIGLTLTELEKNLSHHLAELREAGVRLPLDTLVRRFDLTSLERDVLLLCLAPQMDPTFQRLYGYLQDDATRRYPTPQLALALLTTGADELPAAWHSFQPHAPLRRFYLLAKSEADGVGSMPLHLSERVAGYLQGFNHLDEQVTNLLRPIPPIPLSSRLAELARNLKPWAASNLTQGLWPRLNLVGPTGAGKRATAQALCSQLGLKLYHLNVNRLLGSSLELPHVLEREVVLFQSALYMDAVELDDPAARRLLEDLIADFRAFLLIGSVDALRTDGAVLQLQISKPTSDEQCKLWRQVLEQIPNAVNGEVESIVEQFDFGPLMIARAASQAQERARLRAPEASTMNGEDLWLACREQASRGLDGLAQRISPSHDWDDIVLPADASTQLREIASQVENRNRVYAAWGFGAKLSRGRGISVLFSGPSGTGKTLAAEILAHHLRLDLYRIDLSRVVSKYIGETEKNLGRVFDTAEQSGAILFFDEADALFGKRTEIKDSHDRYANIEIDYLLQRMEEYRGLAILATNMKSHLDSAFLRRLRFLVEFPFPTADYRRAIWKKSFPPDAPVLQLQYDMLAQLEISGGNIHNIVLNAAFLAASEDLPIGMDHLMRAAKREYAKEEKLLTPNEFGSYYGAVRP